MALALPTWFLQSAQVNKDAELVSDRWFTLASFDEDLARYHAERMVERGSVPITDTWQLRKSEHESISAVRVVSLLELLEEGEESPSVYWAIRDLSDADRMYFVNCFLGYEAE